MTKTRYITINLTFILLTILCSLTAPAQYTPAPPEPKNEQPKHPGQVSQGALNEEIVIISNYKPKFTDAVKVRRNPQFDKRQYFKATMHYQPIEKRLEDNDHMEPLTLITPLTPEPRFKNNYVKLALGTPFTSYANAHLATRPSQTAQVVGYLAHWTQSGNINNQRASQQEVAVSGKYIMDILSVQSDLGYRYNSNYFYGYDPKHPPSILNSEKQRFHLFTGCVKVIKNEPTAEDDFMYEATAHAYTFNNVFDMQENDLLLSGYVNKSIHPWHGGVATSLNLSRQKDKVHHYNNHNHIFCVHPYLKLRGAYYTIDAGVNLVSTWVSGTKNKFFMFPTVHMVYQIIPSYVAIFANMHGTVHKASYKNFYEKNPFLGRNISLTNSVNWPQLQVGLKGSLAPKLGFSVAFISESIHNMPLIMNDFSKTKNKFKVIYAAGPTKVRGLDGSIHFEALDMLQLFGQISVRDYKLAREKEAWNRENIRLTLGSKLQVTSKITLNQSLLFRGHVKDLAMGKQVVTIPSFLDLNLGVVYKTTEALHAWIQCNNFLNKQYQTFLHYPHIGRNILAGVNLSF